MDCHIFLTSDIEHPWFPEWIPLSNLRVFCPTFQRLVGVLFSGSVDESGGAGRSVRRGGLKCQVEERKFKISTDIKLSEMWPSLIIFVKLTEKTLSVFNLFGPSHQVRVAGGREPNAEQRNSCLSPERSSEFLPETSIRRGRTETQKQVKSKNKFLNWILLQ